MGVILTAAELWELCKDQHEALTRAHAHIRNRDQRILELETALKPFAHDDLCVELGGNVQGEDSPVFQRRETILTLGDFRAARGALSNIMGVSNAS